MKLNHQGTPVLKTSMCLLRPLQESDVSDLHSYISLDEEIHETFLFPDYKEIGQTKQFVESQIKQYQNNNFYLWAIVHHETQETIGLILTLNADDANYATEIGYVIARPYWNQGIATECLKIVTEYLFVVGYHRLIASYLLGNEASGKVMEKCGFRREGIFRDALFYHNRFHTLVQMSKIGG